MAARALDTALTVTVGLVSAAAIGTTAVAVHLATDHEAALASTSTTRPDPVRQPAGGSDDDTTGPGDQAGLGTLPGVDPGQGSSSTGQGSTSTGQGSTGGGFSQVSPPQGGGGGRSHSGSGGS